MATKTANIETLKGLGVELSGDETAAELADLVKTHTPATAGVTASEAKTETTDDEADEEVDGDSVTVSFIDPNLGQTERVFDKATHGKDFAKLAKRFCVTHSDKGAQVVK